MKKYGKIRKRKKRSQVEISDRYAEIIEFLEGDDDDEEY